MNRSAADQLHRLRLWLTLLFTGMNAAGLVTFAWLIIDLDASRVEPRLDAELDRVTSTVARLVRAEGDTVDTSAISDDQINGECPQFAVLSGGASSTPQDFQYFSANECVPVDRGKLRAAADKAARSGRSQEGYIRGADGRWLRFAAEPIRVGTGAAIGAVVSVVDSEPERARHEQLIVLVVLGCVAVVAGLGIAGHMLSGRAMRPAVNALQQQEVLLAETAHDLRTPVAALSALAQTAVRNPDQTDELLPRTVRLASRMGGIIDGLLVRARLAANTERLAVQPVWLDQLVSGVLDETPTTGAHVTLTAVPTKVMVDPTLVQRAVGNLMDNALRYGRRPDQQQAVVHVSVYAGRVAVADNGPGVDPAIAHDGFERAFDRQRTGSGSTGLGLSIVRWVAQAHGGTLAIYNADEGGAIFELTFPEVP